MSSISDHDALMDRANRANAPAWKPALNDTLTGRPVAVRLSPESAEGYVEYPIVTFRLQDGSYINFHIYHGIARAELRDRADALAAAIKADGGAKDWTMVYLGEHITNKTKDLPAKDQTTYHLYHFEIDGEKAKAAEAFDYASI